MTSPLTRTATRFFSEEILLNCWVPCGVAGVPTEDASGPGLLFPGGGAQSLPHRLVTLINGAQEVVLVASFLLADPSVADAMIAAVQRGVRVYALTASEHRVTAGLRADGEEDKLAEEHKRLLGRLAGKVTLRTSEHLHAKFVVVDPSASVRAVVSTANFNKALWDKIELGVEVEPDLALSLVRLFSWVFWMEAERELVAGDRLLQVAPPPAEPVLRDSQGLFLTTQQRTTLGAECLRLVRSARKSIALATFTLEAEHAVTQALVEQAQAGREVVLFLPPRARNAAAVQRLAAAGASVYGHPKLHAKVLVTDEVAMLMTANVARDGLDSGFEVGVRLGDDARDRLASTLAIWRSKLFPWRFMAKVRQGDVVGDILVGADGDKLAHIVKRETIRLPPVEARDAVLLEEAPEPKLEVPRDLSAHQVDFTWEVRPPRLPSGAQELFQELPAQESGKSKAPPLKVPFRPPRFQTRGANPELLIGYEPEIGEPELRALAKSLGARVVVV